MKMICVLLLALTATASAAVSNRALGDIPNSAFLDAIENLRQEMPCGIGNGPPLAPLKIAQRDVNMDTSGVTVEGTVEDLELIGLNEFVMNSLNVNILSGSITAEAVFNSLRFNTLYDGKMSVDREEGKFDVAGKGSASITVEDFKLILDAKFSVNIFTTKATIKSFDLLPSIGNIKSNINGLEEDEDERANEFLSETLVIYVNNNAEQISRQIEERVLPVLNDYLQEHSINDLINSSGDGDESPVCDPSTLSFKF